LRIEQAATLEQLAPRSFFGSCFDQYSRFSGGSIQRLRRAMTRCEKHRGGIMASGSSTSLADRDWLVGSFSRRQAIAALWMGSVGLLILGLQPILLGAMFAEGRVSLDELAAIATAENLTIAIGSATPFQCRRAHLQEAWRKPALG
jgi:hypothetical protein